MSKTVKTCFKMYAVKSQFSIQTFVKEKTLFTKKIILENFQLTLMDRQWSWLLLTCLYSLHANFLEALSQSSVLPPHSNTTHTESQK